MPYIDKWRREDLVNAKFCDLLKNITNLEVGDLNFLISKLIWARYFASENYTTANALLGVLEAAKLEFYRRHVAIYEDIKITQNGDLDEN